MWPAEHHCFTRRDLLGHAAGGVAGVCLAGMLLRDGLLHGEEGPKLKGLHHPALADRLIHIFLAGGLSQVDSFDYKPELEKRHDQEMPTGGEKIDVFNSKVGRLHRSHFKFAKRGESGLWVSELFPEIAGVADELTVINSLFAETGNHIPGIFQGNTGFRQMGFPAMGAWMSYGLGSENDSLPAFVVLPDKGGFPNAAGGAFNWTSGFLPARHQGVPFSSRGEPIHDLSPHREVSAATQQARLALLQRLNERHLAEQTQTDPLVARIKSYELAARMQSEIPPSVDLAAEPQHIHQLYGTDRQECEAFAKNCLMARRLVERGVRCVQLWSGDGVAWDSHDDVTSSGYKGHAGMARQVDRPIAGLLRDLRQRGLLDRTLVVISTEFGRTPFAQAPKGKINKGRDHNQDAYTNLLIGPGLKKGFRYGATDEFGYRAAEQRTSIYDFHATILHLMGIDHERLTFYHNGIERRLTNVHGHVVEGVLA